MAAVAPFEIGPVRRDLDVALPFYTGVLGLALRSDGEVPAATSRAGGLAPDGCRVVHYSDLASYRLPEER
jgi:hypothetical protein